MKKMTKFFALALLAGAMVSCSTEDTAPSVQNDKVAVQFTGGISVNTRAAGLAWAEGDMIGIFMTGTKQPLSADAIQEGVDNICYQTSGSIGFSPVSGGKTVFFPIDGDVDFYSYYPQTTVNEYKVALNVADQKSQEAIDFMYAKTTGCNKATPAARVFTLIPPVNCTAPLSFWVEGAVSSVLHETIAPAKSARAKNLVIFSIL